TITSPNRGLAMICALTAAGNVGAHRAGDYLLGAEPAGLEEVDRHAVRPRKLDLDVASLSHLFRPRVRTVHRTCLLDPRPCLFHVLDFYTEVVDAVVPDCALCGGGSSYLNFRIARFT